MNSQRADDRAERTVAAAPADARAELVVFRGRALWLRQLETEDRASIEALLARTEVQDLHMRFFAAFHRVPPELLDELMRIDRAGRVTLVAAHTGRGDPEILAVARAHLLADGDAAKGVSAEVAMLVRSDLKGIGLGTLLLGRLIARCRERGISRLLADVLLDNARMLRLAEKFGFHRAHSEFGTVRLVLALLPRRTAAQSNSPPGTRPCSNDGSK